MKNECNISRAGHPAGKLVEQYRLRMDPEISWCEDFMFNLEYIRRAKRFYALQLPIYYYVKTKGSLATQGLSLTKTVKMKLSVFEYYQQFFKEVLDEEEYERSRLKVYRFLVDAAGDGAVPPLPTAQRLGSERVRACSAVTHLHHAHPAATVVHHLGCNLLQNLLWHHRWSC